MEPAPKNKGGRPKGAKSHGGDIARALRLIIKENDKDRVAALRLLADLRTQGGDIQGPPAPNDEAGMVEALSRMLLSAGESILQKAIARSWPGSYATIVPEAQVGTETQVQAAPDSLGTPPGRSNLD